MTKILVFGETGQVASCLQDKYSVLALGRGEADLSQPQSCTAAIDRLRPDAVINAAAYTAVDRAEGEEKLATVINGDAPAAMACTCAALGVPFVHISTDYVFPGTGEDLWQPGDATAPFSVYGRTKLLGEQGVAAAGGTYAILRTAWVFSAYGQNFVKTMLRLGAKRDQLTVVTDQIGGPTPASAIAAACFEIAGQLSLDRSKAGIYHFAGAPDISWAGFAREIFTQAKLDCEVGDILTSDYPTAAQRPLNSRLDCGTTEAVFGIKRPDWRSELRTVLQQIRDKED
jgi:dTDP-4-dehydrorhamnose reductase